MFALPIIESPRTCELCAVVSNDVVPREILTDYKSGTKANVFSCSVCADQKNKEAFIDAGLEWCESCRMYCENVRMTSVVVDTSGNTDLVPVCYNCEYDQSRNESC